MKKIISILLLLLFTTSCSTFNKSGGGFFSRQETMSETAEELAPEVPNYILFDLNSTKLDQEARNTLDQQISWLKVNRDVNVIIEGHCDERGTREYNLALGAKRADITKRYLTSHGVQSSRLSTISYGKERPFVEGSGSDAWKENRRAITILN